LSWTILHKNGLQLPQIGWWLDPSRPVDKAIVSHAHFDHLAASREVVCTPATARFMRHRLPRKRVEHRLPFGQTEPLTPDCSVTLLPAGPILLNHRELGSLLYTGDFKLRQGLVAETCATPRADTLVMETTFGRSHYCMPPSDQVRAQLQDFCSNTLAAGDTPVLMAYSLGKAQEVLASLAGLEAPIMVHPQIAEMNRLHEDLGVVLPPHRLFDDRELAGHVVLCAPASKNSAFLKRIPRARTAFVSGWALDRSTVFRQRCDAAFPLSDHADYPDLLCFVDLVKPKRVLTLHGFAADFARTLRERGYDALALSEPNQLDLGLQ
jgi:Cft2 family RNA processing exonuclease